MLMNTPEKAVAPVETADSPQQLLLLDFLNFCSFCATLYISAEQDI